MLCFCRGRHPYSLELQLKNRLDQIQLPRVDSCNQDAATRSAFWRILRQYFQNKSSPFFSLQRLPSLLFFISQAFYFFQRLTFLKHKYTTHLHSSTDSVVCWKFCKFWWIWITYSSQSYWRNVTELAKNFVCTLNRLIRNQERERHCLKLVCMLKEN